MIKISYLLLELFILFYHPTILGINSWLLIGVASCIYIIINFNVFRHNIFVIKLIKIYLFFIILTLYLFIIVVINNTELRWGCVWAYVIVGQIPTAVAITMQCTVHRYDFTKLLKMTVNAGIIQALCSVALFFSPQYKLFLFKLSVPSIEYYSLYQSLLTHRMYGLGGALNFTMPVLQAILSTIAFYFFFLERKNIYLFYTILLLFSSIINARTGAVVASLGYILVITYLLIHKVSLFRLLKSIIACVFFSFPLLLLVKTLNYQTYWWIMRGIQTIFDFLILGHNKGIFIYWSQSFSNVYIHSMSNYIFGYGTRIMFPNRLMIQSDVGYINDIMLGGIVYCALTYCIFLYFVLQIGNSRCIRHQYAFVVYYFTLLFMILNMKGYIYSANDFIAFFILLYIFIIVKKEGRSFNISFL